VVIVAIVALGAFACGKESAESTAVTTAPASSAASSSPLVPSSAPTAPAPPVDAAATSPSAPPDTVIAQHILVAYRTARRAPKGVTRSKAEAKARASEALAKIRAGTTFEDAVKEYSDDAGSADRMGSVGKFHRADMDAAFSAAAFALGVGQVSEVVETPFGFHVIKRTQ
jgi:peptidyl-prolyl cis-trans isomerase NIMA-interacting 1